MQVHPAARKKQAAPKPGSEEEQVLQRQQQEAAQRQAYQQGALRRWGPLCCSSSSSSWDGVRTCLPACLLVCMPGTLTPVHPCTPALPSPAVRFTLPDDLGTDAGASPQGDEPAAKRKRGKDGAAEGERRPAGAVQCYLCMALHRQHMGAP